MDLITTLKRLGQAINHHYPSINQGGCCVFAAIVGEQLKRLDIEVGGLVGRSRWHKGRLPNIAKVREKLNNPKNNVEWWDKGVDFNHVALQFKYEGREYYYDTDGCVFACYPSGRYVRHFGKFNWKRHSGLLTVDELKGLAAKSRGWNSAFDRKKIPALRKHIKEVFKVLTDR